MPDLDRIEAQIQTGISGGPDPDEWGTEEIAALKALEWLVGVARLAQIVCDADTRYVFSDIHTLRAALAATTTQGEKVRNGVCLLCGSAVLNGEHLRDDLEPCFGATTTQEPA